jgi:anti-anti-sigma factor
VGVSSPPHDVLPGEGALTVTRDERPAVTVLRVLGDVDLATEEHLVASVRTELSNPSANRVLLDLSRVGFMSSSGIGYLLLLTTEARAQDVRFGIVSGMNRRITGPIAAMRLGRALNVHPSVEAATADGDGQVGGPPG